MSTSRNSWSFDGKIFGCGFMSLNDEKLKLYDISRKLVMTLAVMIAANKLDKIKCLFIELTDQQKKGLLSVTIDYDQVTDSGYFSKGPLYFGDPIEVAKQFNFKEIEEFFTTQQSILNSNTLAKLMRASAGELTQDDLLELNRPATPVIPSHSSYHHSDDSDSASASPSLRRR